TLILREVGVSRVRPATVPRGGAGCFVLSDVGYDASLAFNLISMSKLDQAGYDILTGDGRAVISRRQDGRVIAIATKQGNLYVIKQKQAEHIMSVQDKLSEQPSQTPPNTDGREQKNDAA